ncbi:MAG: multidrug efflux SMR transporter [Reyranellaceae bacterium]
MIWFYAALGAAILCGVAGQLLLKEGAAAADFVQQLFRPTTMVGLGFYALAALLYIVALRKIPVSVAFPSVSLSYVVVAVAGHFLWNEPFGLAQIAGLALICGGVLVLSQA